MGKYTVRSFSGHFTLVAMNSPSDFFRLPRSIKLSITFHHGRIDEDSKAALTKLINEIQSDVKADSKLIAPHWYDDKGKVGYVETEYDTNAGPDDKGRVIEARTFPLTSEKDLEDFLGYLYSLANPLKQVKSPNAFTPLLSSRVSSKPEHEHTSDIMVEHSVAARTVRLLKCCFGY